MNHRFSSQRRLRIGLNSRSTNAAVGQVQFEQCMLLTAEEIGAQGLDGPDPARRVGAFGGLGLGAATDLSLIRPILDDDLDTRQRADAPELAVLRGELEDARALIAEPVEQQRWQLVGRHVADRNRPTLTIDQDERRFD